MLSVTIKINGRIIGEATAVNKTEVGNPCRYACDFRSEHSPVTGQGPFFGGFDVNGHDRAQSAWALVAKMAENIVDTENGSPKLLGDPVTSQEDRP